ncbi:MAG: septum formation initiator family protein [Nitrospirota bacterium]
MGISNNLLRKQVVSEVKKRRLIFSTIILLTFIYFLSTLIFGDMGLLRYKKLNSKKIYLETQITELQKDNEQLRSEIKLLKEDPFFAEKHARENFELAEPDEYIFYYDR